MHDNWLIASALAMAALGITGLMFALIFLESPFADMTQIRAAADGDPLRVKGEVVRVQNRGNITIISIAQETHLDITLFENISLGEIVGECIIASGKRSSYENQAQVVATKISRCT